MDNFYAEKQIVIEKIKNLKKVYESMQEKLEIFSREMKEFLEKYDEVLRRDMEDLPIWLVMNLSLKEIDQIKEILKFFDKVIEYFETEE
ncbi:MAG: hypothetical protein ACTSRP_01780 [Candidatus Helarchaeota archaeon]